MATPPTLVGKYESAWNTATTPKTQSITVQTGDRLVYIGTTENQDVLNVPTGGGLTWTAAQSITASSQCRMYSWTTTASSGQTFTLSGTKGSGSNHWGFVVYHYRGSAGIGATAKTANGTAGAPSLNITTTQANSAVVFLSSDWAGTTGTKTYRTGAGAISAITGIQDNQTYSVYGGSHADAGTAAAKTVGMTAPTGQTYSLVAVEVKGSTAVSGSITGAVGHVTAAAITGLFTALALLTGTAGAATAAAPAGGFAGSATLTGSSAAAAASGDPGAFSPTLEPDIGTEHTGFADVDVFALADGNDTSLKSAATQAYVFDRGDVSAVGARIYCPTSAGTAVTVQLQTDENADGKPDTVAATTVSAVIPSATIVETRWDTPVAMVAGKYYWFTVWCDTGQSFRYGFTAEEFGTLRPVHPDDMQFPALPDVFFATANETASGNGSFSTSSQFPDSNNDGIWLGIDPIVSVADAAPGFAGSVGTASADGVAGTVTGLAPSGFTGTPGTATAAGVHGVIHGPTPSGEFTGFDDGYFTNLADSNDTSLKSAATEFYAASRTDVTCIGIRVYCPTTAGTAVTVQLQNDTNADGIPDNVVASAVTDTIPSATIVETLFDTPVLLDPATYYWAAVYCDTGQTFRYGFVSEEFGTSRPTHPADDEWTSLTGMFWANGAETASGNGSFSTTLQFPDQSSNSLWYGIDPIVTVPGATDGDVDGTVGPATAGALAGSFTAASVGELIGGTGAATGAGPAGSFTAVQVGQLSGSVGPASAAAPGGAFGAARFGSVTGAVGHATTAAPTGTLDGQVSAALTGVTGAATASASGSTFAGTTAVTGNEGTATASGVAGTFTAAATGTISGTVGHATTAAPTGTFTATGQITGAVGHATAAGPRGVFTGTEIVNGEITGTTGTATAVGVGGSFTAVVTGTLTGSTGHAAAAALTGVMTGQTIGSGNLPGQTGHATTVGVSGAFTAVAFADIDGSTGHAAGAAPHGGMTGAARATGTVGHATAGALAGSFTAINPGHIAGSIGHATGQGIGGGFTSQFPGQFPGATGHATAGGVAGDFLFRDISISLSGGTDRWTVTVTSEE